MVDQLKIFFIIGLLILGSCTRKLEITCPSSITIKLPYLKTPSNSQVLPEPLVMTECRKGQYSLTSDLPDTLSAGQYTVHYEVSDACGNAAECSYQLIATYDFRLPFIGTYIGRYFCYLNGQIESPYLDTISSIKVDYGSSHDQLLIENKDNVLIDSSGSCPNPSCCDYRFYTQTFRNDSLFIARVEGSIQNTSICQFKGRKQ